VGVKFRCVCAHADTLSVFTSSLERRLCYAARPNNNCLDFPFPARVWSVVRLSAARREEITEAIPRKGIRSPLSSVYLLICTRIATLNSSFPDLDAAVRPRHARRHARFRNRRRISRDANCDEPMMRAYSSRTRHAAGWLAAARVGNGAIRTTPEAPSSTHLGLSWASGLVWLVREQKSERRLNYRPWISEVAETGANRAGQSSPTTRRQCSDYAIMRYSPCLSKRRRQFIKSDSSARRQWPRFTARYLALRLDCGTTSPWYTV